MNPQSKEWLEADGLGGFASGTSIGVRTRRYHALLLTATTPPTGRVSLVNGFDAWVETADGTSSLSSQRYSPDVIAGDGAQRIERFDCEPWPQWTFRLDDGTRIAQEVFAIKGQPVTCVSWRVLGPRRKVKLFIRPFLSGRDYHSLHKCNPGFCFDAGVGSDGVSWKPYADLPGVTALTNGSYAHEPHWYYNFLYEEERVRGLDCEEDLAAPGVFSWDLADGEAALIFTTTDHAAGSVGSNANPVELLNELRAVERDRRKRFPSRLHRAADAYIVTRRSRVDAGSPGSQLPAQGQVDFKTIIAGYPWFADWGRDTLIALRGLCLATGRWKEARQILLSWAGTVSRGMLPNRFPDQGDQPEFNSVDASLWFVIAAHEFIQLTRPESEAGSLSDGQSSTSSSDIATLESAIESILEGYSIGTRFGIRLDADGLLACGEPGVQLTWMDAKVGDWVVTPRIGKPVEVQALWLNALWAASQFNPRWKDLFRHGRDSFRQKFWNESRQCLFDVADADHQSGLNDATLRPNQILAVGGLPEPLIDGERARLVVQAVEDHLVTPLGLRSLATNEPGYASRYEGGVRARDGAYHQGTVWPWLIGPFVEAWLRVHGASDSMRRTARERFLKPLLAHLDEAGIGHISEIADAEEPHAPHGCPFQAWSVGEALRLDLAILAERRGRRVSTRTSPNARSQISRASRAARRRDSASPQRIQVVRGAGRRELSVSTQ